ncbi:hypothetical protein F5Y01DRAFT_323025 [Xylaria sp. FL0043]|nr:hypothetical protein F5Y01DRAFT_323025 [Xylaria sp. FL0043]
MVGIMLTDPTTNMTSGSTSDTNISQWSLLGPHYFVLAIGLAYILIRPTAPTAPTAPTPRRPSTPSTEHRPPAKPTHLIHNYNIYLISSDNYEGGAALCSNAILQVSGFHPDPQASSNPIKVDVNGGIHHGNMGSITNGNINEQNCNVSG